ncbi:MAG: thioredoxin [Haloferacaceae archaeon]
MATKVETDEPIHVNGTEEFDDLISGGETILVDFHADWCGPCKMIEPIVEDIAAETDAIVAKVDVDANQPLAQNFGVRGVPTLLVFDDGEKVERLVGVQSEEQLKTVVGRYT